MQADALSATDGESEPTEAAALVATAQRRLRARGLVTEAEAKAGAFFLGEMVKKETAELKAWREEMSKRVPVPRRRRSRDDLRKRRARMRKMEL